MMPITVSKPRNWPYVLFGVAAIPNILFLGHLLTPTAPAVSPILRWFLWALLAAGFSALFAALFTDPRLRHDPEPPAKPLPPPRIAPSPLRSPRRPRLMGEQERTVVVQLPRQPTSYESSYAHRAEPEPPRAAPRRSTDVPPLETDPKWRAGRDWGRMERDHAESTDVIAEEYDDPPAQRTGEDRP